MEKYYQIINDVSDRYNVDPLLIGAIIGQESAGNPNAVSNKGAGGLMQLMPSTAAELGVTNVNDPAQNIDGGTRYFADLLNKYKQKYPENTAIQLALAAYNAGAGAVSKYGGIPPYTETQNYVSKIWTKYNQLKGTAGSVFGSITHTNTTTSGDSSQSNKPLFAIVVGVVGLFFLINTVSSK